MNVSMQSMQVPDSFKLREVESRDLSMLLQWQNASHIRETAFNDRVIKQEEAQQWFDALQNERRCKRLVFEGYGIPMGLIVFTSIDRKHSTAHWGFYLGRPDFPKGTGTILTYHGLQYAFGELHLRKICAEILDSNIRSINLHRKLGFTWEGIFREHILRNGNYHDVLVMALFERDWVNNRASLNKPFLPLPAK